MINCEQDVSAKARRWAYAVLICAGVGGMLGRILAVDQIDDSAKQEYRVRKELDVKRKAYQKDGLQGDAIDELLVVDEARLRERIQLRRPFLSANDRSRWCTVRALVEPEMKVPGKPYAIDRVVEQPRWDTIDMVKCRGHFYSSKPTLLPTLLAGEYWLIYHLTGFTLAEDTFEVVRFMLITVNVLPLAIYFWLLALLAERFGRTDFGRMFMMGAATFGTFLTTFAVVLNNHVIAAVSVAVALYAWVRIWFDEDRGYRNFAIAGVFGAFAAANELPALSFLCALAASLAWKAWRRFALAFVPAAALVAGASFVTNWIAFESLRPPYAHRSKTDPSDNWYAFEYVRHGEVVPSYWTSPAGLDRGESSAVVYAVNVLVGHHGILSLSPIWMLAIAGMGIWAGNRNDPRLRAVAWATAFLSAVVLFFYLSRSQGDRNYGGMTCGLRWMFWFAPLWLVAMLPAVDWAASRRWARVLALLFLIVSVLSIAYPTWNPWSHPWLYHLGQDAGWL